MRSYRRKNKFFTIVIKNKKPYITAMVVLFFIWGVLLSYKNIKAPCDIYERAYDIFEGSAMLLGGRKNIEDSFDVFGFDSVLKFSSAMFYKTDKARPSKAVADEPEPKNDGIARAAVSSAKIITDSIKSDPFSIKNETEYEINPQELLNQQRTYNTSGSEPRVLIVHTHACETYSSPDGTGLGSVGTYRSRDNNINMIKIGEVIEKAFKNSGISVIHDKTLCDYPAYNSSYVKSLGVIDWYLERYPTIEFVFDIHRDAIAADDGTAKKLIADIDGKAAAQAMIVCGTDALGLTHPYWKDNLILALKIQKNTEDIAPGLMRPVNLRRERFNMHKTKGSLLFEVGTHGNTLEEAKLCAEYLSQGIIKTIK